MEGTRGRFCSRMTRAIHLLEILDRQRAAGLVSGDRFAKPGANERIWGALDKLAVAHPRYSSTTTPTTSSQ